MRVLITPTITLPAITTPTHPITRAYTDTRICMHAQSARTGKSMRQRDKERSRGSICRKVRSCSGCFTLFNRLQRVCVCVSFVSEQPACVCLRLCDCKEELCLTSHVPCLSHLMSYASHVLCFSHTDALAAHAGAWHASCPTACLHVCRCVARLMSNTCPHVPTVKLPTWHGSCLTHSQTMSNTFTNNTSTPHL